MSKNNIIAGLMAGLLGTPGDLISRILFFNCSMDKAWTLLFCLPPLSFITGILYFMGKIEAGTESCGSAFDAFTLVIPILTILFKMFIPRVIENNLASSALSFLLILIMYAAIRTFKYSTRCKTMFLEKYKGIGKTQLTKAITMALITNLIIVVFNALSPFGRFIPVIGIAFRIWGYLGKVPGLQTALPLTLAHIISNLQENNKSKMISTCCNPEDKCQ